MKGLIWFCIGVIVLISPGCEKEDDQHVLSSCGLEDIVKTTMDTEGTIWFNSDIQAYVVHVGIDGTYDSQDVGVLCNLPEEFRQEELRIVFSGNYYAYEEEVEVLFPGQSYYHLELLELEPVPLK